MSRMYVAKKPLKKSAEGWEKFIKSEFRDYLKEKAREFAIRV